MKMLLILLLRHSKIEGDDHAADKAKDNNVVCWKWGC